MEIVLYMVFGIIGVLGLGLAAFRSTNNFNPNEPFKMPSWKWGCLIWAFAIVYSIYGLSVINSFVNN